MSNNYIIYKYTSPSGKGYIGQTKNHHARNIQHKSKSSGCVAFKNAIIKYGFNNFLYEIIETNLSLEEANFKEEYYIKYHNTLSQNGYNLQSGGLNRTPTKEIKQKISENHADVSGKNNPMYGKNHTKEAIENMINKKIGSIRTEESKRKQGSSILGQKNHMYGKTGNLAKNAKKYVVTYPDKKN